MSNKQLEESVAPDGVEVPPSHEIDTSEEEGTGSNSASRIYRDNGEKPVDRWKNRRRLAWTAMAALLIGTILLWFVVPINRVQALEEPIIWYYIAMFGVVGAYVGFASIPFGRK